MKNLIIYFFAIWLFNACYLQAQNKVDVSFSKAGFSFYPVYFLGDFASDFDNTTGFGIVLKMEEKLSKNWSFKFLLSLNYHELHPLDITPSINTNILLPSKSTYIDKILDYSAFRISHEEEGLFCVRYNSFMPFIGLNQGFYLIPITVAWSRQYHYWEKPQNNEIEEYFSYYGIGPSIGISVDLNESVEFIYSFKYNTSVPGMGYTGGINIEYLAHNFYLFFKLK